MTDYESKEAFKKRMINETLMYQRKYKFDAGNNGRTTYNNEADAFKHVYMQWSLCMKYGEFMAKMAGDSHEKNEGDIIGERNMDLWNNKIGREIYKEMKEKYGKDFTIENESKYKDEAAARIMEKMKAGELITHPSDKRQFKNMDKERLKPTDRVYYKGELNTMDDETKKAHTEHYVNQAIDSNWEMPSKADLDAKVASGGMIYVDNYTRADGTKVSGYNRMRPIC